ncbi:ATP-binding protein [Halostagnicola bangensis]
MSFVIGRGADLEDGPVGHLGSYRALDGSTGADLHLDLDGPHAMLIVGKRGYGKSFTLGVVAEALSRAPGVSPVLIDPMGVFETLEAPTERDTVSATVLESPTVDPGVLDPKSWCTLLGLSPESGAGGLLWRGAQETETIDEMHDHIEQADAPRSDVRAANNHLGLASSWGIFDTDGITPADLAGPEVTVIDVSGIDSAPMNAICRAVAEALYSARVTDSIDRLPWLLIDEAHTFFDGVAAPALETILTRGRAPGVSLVSATQRPSSVPDVGISQSDIIVSHRLTSRTDLEALERAQPTYVNATLEERMPEDPGEVIVIDDATETTHAARIRSRETPHGGDSPRASHVFPEN